MSAVHALPLRPQAPDPVRVIARTVGVALVSSRDAMNLALTQADTSIRRGQPLDERALQALTNALASVDKALATIRSACQ